MLSIHLIISLLLITRLFFSMQVKELDLCFHFAPSSCDRIESARSKTHTKRRYMWGVCGVCSECTFIETCLHFYLNCENFKRARETIALSKLQSFRPHVQVLIHTTSPLYLSPLSTLGDSLMLSSWQRKSHHREGPPSSDSVQDATDNAVPTGRSLISVCFSHCSYRVGGGYCKGEGCRSFKCCSLLSILLSGPDRLSPSGCSCSLSLFLYLRSLSLYNLVPRPRLLDSMVFTRHTAPQFQLIALRPPWAFASTRIPRMDSTKEHKTVPNTWVPDPIYMKPLAKSTYFTYFNRQS